MTDVRLVGSLVAAAGGQIVVQRKHLEQMFDSVLERYDDIANDRVVYRIRPMTEAEKEARNERRTNIG